MPARLNKPNTGGLNFSKGAYHGRMEEDDLRNVWYPLRP